jgi:Mn-dependent DtxR family transcriptional regulator
MTEELNDKSLMVTVQELNMNGLLSFTDDEKFVITEKGMQVALKLLDKFSIRDRLLIMMMAKEIGDQIMEEAE